MAKKGEDKKLKRLAASKKRHILRKEYKWTIKGKPRISLENSIPLGVVIRDMLEFAKVLKEVKFILHNNKVLVNGIRRKDYKFTLGLFDLLEFTELKKRYRVILDNRGRLKLKEEDFKEEPRKIVRIENKVCYKGKIQLLFDDSHTMLLDNTKLKVGDCLLVSLPEYKILEELKMEKGNLAYSTSGKHAGKLARIIDVVKGGIRKHKMVVLEEKGKQFQTVSKNIYVVGKREPLISLGVEK